MQLVISFDDTGSMASCIKQVRSEIKYLCKDLFDIVPNLEIALIAHNDYCDEDIISVLDFTSDRKELERFLSKTFRGSGGDSDECYELVLNYFHNELSWKSDEIEKYAILIGDALPHKVGYRYRNFTNNLDWKKELSTCIGNNIKVLPIQCLNRSYNSSFYDYLAKFGGFGIKLELSQFQHITQYLTAFVYNQVGKLEQYENSNEEFKTNRSLKNMFATLKGGSVTNSTEETEKLSKFQVLKVTSECVIKDFVEVTGASYKKGKGFYQFTKSETIQANKEVLFVNKKTGDVLDNTIECRKLLGVPFGTKGNVNPSNIREVFNTYNIFIQSNSFNRVLKPNTQFLYELDYR